MFNFITKLVDKYVTKKENELKEIEEIKIALKKSKKKIEILNILQIDRFYNEEHFNKNVNDNLKTHLANNDINLLPIYDDYYCYFETELFFIAAWWSTSNREFNFSHIKVISKENGDKFEYSPISIDPEVILSLTQLVNKQYKEYKEHPTFFKIASKKMILKFYVNQEHVENFYRNFPIKRLSSDK